MSSNGGPGGFDPKIERLKLAHESVPPASILLIYASRHEQVLFDPGEPVAERGDEGVTDPSPQMPRVRVCGISPGLRANYMDVGSQFGTRECQEGAHDRTPMFGNPGEARWPGTFEEAHQHCLDLIVGMMGGHQDRRLILSQQSPKPCHPGIAGPGFRRRGAQPGPNGVNRQVIILSQGGDGAGHGLAGRGDPVIKVSHSEVEASGRPGLACQIEQGDRVGPAGHRDQHGSAWECQPIEDGLKPNLERVHLRRKSSDDPTGGAVAVEEPVVESAWPPLPELHRVRDNPESAPMDGIGDLTIAKP